jgi:hypothetical protein
MRHLRANLLAARDPGTKAADLPRLPLYMNSGLAGRRLVTDDKSAAKRAELLKAL